MAPGAESSFSSCLSAVVTASTSLMAGVVEQGTKSVISSWLQFRPQLFVDEEDERQQLSMQKLHLVFGGEICLLYLH